MIIERFNEVNRIKSPRKWVLVYGRRKTGKTFLVENFIDYDEYFFVKRDKSIISKSEGRGITYETFIELLKRGLSEQKVIVVDEFHRLGDDFFDFLQYTKKEGKLILISSTLFLSKRIFSARSPLLGFFVEVPIGLVDLGDCAVALAKFKLDRKALTELSILLREPIAVDFFAERAPPKEIAAELLLGSIRTIPALVGEIFAEEERVVSAVYEGILRAIANGKVISSDIASYLFSRKLIPKDDPSIIQQYLKNLIEFGIIKKIPVYGKKKFVYKHTSPLVRLFYYADEKYNISERKSSKVEIERIASELMPKLVEDQVREHIAGKLGLSEAIAEAKDFEIDACLLRFKRPKVTLEIKWKEKIDKGDLINAERSLGRIKADEKFLFVPDKRKIRFPTTLKIVDISDFM